jgi:hypothetical protein
LTSTAATGLHDTRTGQNTQHSLLALLRQSIYSRLAGYEDVNDAERLCLDPAMRTVVGGRAKDHTAASTTFTLCSIGDVDQALSETYRVLKPGGWFLFLEHGLSPEPRVQKWQRRLNWLQMRLANGCHLDRNIRALVTAQPFASVRIDEFYIEKTPKTHGYTYRGVATK